MVKLFTFKPTHTVIDNRTQCRVRVRVVKVESYEAFVESRLPNWLGGVNGLLPSGMTSTLREIDP